MKSRMGGVKIAAKIHFVGRIDPEAGNGWAFCGRLVREERSYDEDIPGRDLLTCKTCQK